METSNFHLRIIRIALLVNAIFSVASGLILIFMNNTIARLTGIQSNLSLIIIGIILLAFAVDLFLNSRSSEINYEKVKVASILDISWVLGSAIFIIVEPDSVTPFGNFLIAVVAIIVALFAAFQMYGYRDFRESEQTVSINFSQRIRNVLNLKSMANISLWFLVFAASLLHFSAAYQAATIFSENSKYQPHGQLIDIGGYRLHLSCMGKGTPTVLIDTGTSELSLDFLNLARKIERFTKVCIYDRAGYGWSDSSPLARTSVNISRELNILIMNAKIEPPYILVGHSFGGINVRVFADLYPEKVSGIVLVESSHEEQWEKLPQEVSEFLNSRLSKLKIVSIMARFGLLRWIEIPTPKLLDMEYHDFYKSVWSRAKTYNALIREMDVLEKSFTQGAASKMRTDLPLVVISSQNSFESFREFEDEIPIERSNQTWMELQRDLLTLSENSLHVISEKGTHEINYTEPERIASAIHKMINAEPN